MHITPHRETVSVVRGGNSDEYDLSLDTGRAILSALKGNTDVRDIFVDRKDRWHHRGVPVDAPAVIKGSSVVVNAMHGHSGEGGYLQKLCRNLHTSYTGSPALASSLSLQKHAFKEVMTSHGVRTPNYRVVDHAAFSAGHNVVSDIYRTLFPPYVVKPLAGGAGRDVSVVDSTYELNKELERRLDARGAVLIEEYINGTLLSVGTVRGFRSEDVYVLLPTAIMTEGPVFNYRDRHTDMYKSATDLPKDVKEEVRTIARGVHQILGLRDYARIEFIYSPNRGLYVLEVNAQPHLGNHSPYVFALKEVGSSIEEFMKHIITLHS